VTPSIDCLNLVKKWEGCRLKAYQDQKGIWTIGYGITGSFVKPNLTWTQAQADEALQEHLDTIGRLLCHKIVPIIEQHQFDAICCLVYNIGIAAFGGSTMLRLLNERKWKEASEEFPKWDKINKAVSQGLLNRRLDEQKLFNKA
jgi:lysozyme